MKLSSIFKFLVFGLMCPVFARAGEVTGQTPYQYAPLTTVESADQVKTPDDILRYSAHTHGLTYYSTTKTQSRDAVTPPAGTASLNTPDEAIASATLAQVDQIKSVQYVTRQGLDQYFALYGTFTGAGPYIIQCKTLAPVRADPPIYNVETITPTIINSSGTQVTVMLPGQFRTPRTCAIQETDKENSITSNAFAFEIPGIPVICKDPYNPACLRAPKN